MAELLHAEEEAGALRELNAALISTLDLARSAALLTEGLANLGIETAYLTVREGSPISARWQRLILACREGQRVDASAPVARYPTTVLLPPELWPACEPFSLVAAPLSFEETLLGTVVLGVGPEEGRFYDELQTELSSVLRAYYLYEEALRARAAAEQADQLKTRLMANVSHELRAPLHVILRQTRDILGAQDEATLDPGAPHKAVAHIQTKAEHQLRMVNDLLDLSRAEINELQISLTLIDPRPFLEEAFMDLASTTGSSPEVAWKIDLPSHLPAIHADPDRLRQILYNLLSNAARYTQAGYVMLGAEAVPPHLHIWVKDTGLGIPKEQQERIFEPFTTVERREHKADGVGLGLTITRRLVALHGGTITLDSRIDRGSTFHVYLPLPARRTRSSTTDRDPVLLVVSPAAEMPEDIAPEIVDLACLRGLTIHQLGPSEDVDQILAEVKPLVMAWERSPGECDEARLRALCSHPDLSQVPCVFFGGSGITHTAPKPVSEAALISAVAALGRTAPATRQAARPILIVDDDPHARQSILRVITDHMPAATVETAGDGAAAVASMMKRRPAMVVLDLNMPEMDGFEVLDWMRTYRRTQRVPVLILSGRMLTLDDIERLERHAHVTLQSKEILSEDETAATLHRVLFGDGCLPTQTSMLVKRAIGHIHQSYDRPITRSDIAGEIGVSDDYLSSIFKEELGLTPWEYLSRYRITRASHLLDRTGDAIGKIAQTVGFEDPAYFSRVFRKIMGTSPSGYRARSESEG
jgi:signal transduction histidine kinase/AraC-like DNA-binding protein